jgi:hypothetical protein
MDDAKTSNKTIKSEKYEFFNGISFPDYFTSEICSRRTNITKVLNLYKFLIKRQNCCSKQNNYQKIIMQFSFELIENLKEKQRFALSTSSAF